ncbi:MAG TPA: TetR/AcrR family transcriptional regulator [Gammaproteobacteria bacterium]
MSVSRDDVRPARQAVRQSSRDGLRESSRGPAGPLNGIASLTEAAARSLGSARAKEQEVLDVASAYFLKHGYQGASINEMARSSGISKESIYRYFSSKKQLFEAVIGRELFEYQQQLNRLDASLKTMDLREALMAIAETVLGLVATDKTLALRRLVFAEATRSPDVGHHYYEIGPKQALRVLETVFEAHREKSPFDPQTLARHFLAIGSWRLMLELECGVRAPPTKSELHAWVETTVDDFMKAFLRA